jgi:hypothetical protein
MKSIDFFDLFSIFWYFERNLWLLKALIYKPHSAQYSTHIVHWKSDQSRAESHSWISVLRWESPPEKMARQLSCLKKQKSEILRFRPQKSQDFLRFGQLLLPRVVEKCPNSCPIIWDFKNGDFWATFQATRRDGLEYKNTVTLPHNLSHIMARLTMYFLMYFGRVGFLAWLYVYLKMWILWSPSNQSLCFSFSVIYFGLKFHHSVSKGTI